MELALDVDDAVEPASGAHYGISVESAQDVEKAIDRLNGAGVRTKTERDETCCHARQTKVWTADPHGRRWEIYTVHHETAERA